MSPEELMRLAIAKARAGIAAGQSPFGCAILLDDDQLVSCEHNTVLASLDATAHAEINAIRAGCRRRRSHLLEGAVVATTCEPCPMCMAALHWARAAEVHFGATISDAESAGFNELHLPAHRLLSEGRSPLHLQGGLLADDCRQLFEEWLASPLRQAY